MRDHWAGTLKRSRCAGGNGVVVKGEAQQRKESGKQEQTVGISQNHPRSRRAPPPGGEGKVH